MYFEFLEYYKRDITFVFNETQSDIDISLLKAGQLINADKTLVFNIDKIDSYINTYDVLPTFNTPLVSIRFKNTFNNLKDDIQFVKVSIIDENNNHNEDYYLMNILNIMPLMDKNRSLFEIEKYGKAEVLVIKKLYITDLKGHSISRMAEHESYIITTEDFKKRCEDAGLKGILFVPEGDTIYKGL